jgi:pteridine reductase
MSAVTTGVALVTGSGKQRIGWHVALALAARGFDIAVHYRSSAAEAAETVEHLRQLGVHAEAFQADFAVDGQASELVAATLDRFGRIDVLTNCAAVWRRKRLEDVTLADLRMHVDTNLVGTFLCTQQAGLAMVRQPQGGCIINFGDWATARPYLDYSAYFAGKGAIPTLTSTLAVELGTRNPRVRVNAILPGPVMFPPDLPAGEREQAIRSTLVHREGTPENIVQAVLYLLDNDFVTGSCLTVDGGRTIYSGSA